MSEHGLSPQELEQQFSVEVDERSTFETHGVSRQVALDYLDTPEGVRYLQLLKNADPAAPDSKIVDRAIGQITSGRDLPRMEVIDEPLVKIVPRGTPASEFEFSSYFAKASEPENALAKGHALNDSFGLPIKSEAAVYDVYQIRPNGPTEVFVSEVAPTSELGGQVRHVGGARQYLVPNRGLFNEAVRVTSLGNDLALHNELVVGKGLGMPIVAAEAATLRGLRPGAAMKSLGVVAAAATVYDIADTAHEVSRLRSQGNATATQAQIERFAIQNAAGWTGAATFAAAGAGLGVESGPGLLVTGAIGGILGAVAGDRIGDWLVERKINQQDDPQGHTWTFDPAHAERGWTRLERELDVQAMSASTRGAPIYKEYTLTADRALSGRLTWQASVTSIELALGAPPQNRDPYRMPVDAAEAAQRQPFETGRVWVRDPQTRRWQQEITAVLDGRIPVTRHEPAGSEQADALERRSQAIIERNAMQTPAAMAVRFQAAYERNGWSQYGPLPEAVTDALRHPGRVVGSDGDLYERNAQGQWTHDGLIWDSQAQDKLLHELEATHQRQQANAHTVTLDTVHVTAPVPGQTPDSAHALPHPAATSAAHADAGHAGVPDYLRSRASFAPGQTTTAHEAPSALDEPTAPQSTAFLPPFSDPQHPRHALYANAQARFPELSEARLNQVTAEMHKIGITPGWEGQAVALNGAVWVRRLDMPGERFMIDLSQPEPPVQQTMQQVQEYDRAEQQRLAQNQQQDMARGQTGPAMGA